MDNYYVKDPVDCTNGELDRYLLHKGLSDVKNLIKSDKVKLAKQFLARENRNTIVFRKPKSLLGKSIFHVKKYLNKDSVQENLPFKSNEIVPSAPSNVSSNLINLS